MHISRLYHEQEIAAGEHVRIWERQKDYLFEHLLPTGRSVGIVCETLQDALVLWQQLDKGHVPDTLQETMKSTGHKKKGGGVKDA